MEKKKFKCYKCYSNNLKNYLMEQGEEYIAVAIDAKSKKTFWMFLRSPKLDQELTKWTEGNPYKK